MSTLMSLMCKDIIPGSPSAIQGFKGHTVKIGSREGEPGDEAEISYKEIKVALPCFTKFDLLLY